MNKTAIEWCTHSWNPITGCKRGCPYCYARLLHEMRGRALLAGKNLPGYYREPFETITVHKNRWDDPIKLKKPAIIFVGSMSDIAYWNKDNLDGIIMTCAHCTWHTFMFLSKDSLAYTGKIWPQNTMQGLTLTCQQSPREQEDEHENMKMYPRPYLSIEPLLGTLYYDRNLKIYEKIIIGTDSNKGAAPPKSEWIQSVKHHAPADKLFWKSNIKGYL